MAGTRTSRLPLPLGSSCLVALAAYNTTMLAVCAKEVIKYTPCFMLAPKLWNCPLQPFSGVQDTRTGYPLLPTPTTLEGSYRRALPSPSGGRRVGFEQGPAHTSHAETLSSLKPSRAQKALCRCLWEHVQN